MQTIKIFLASSQEMEDDCEQLILFIQKQNGKYVSQKIHFQIIYWEDFRKGVSQTCLQEEYTKLVASCDIFVFFFKTQVSKYFEEKFYEALKVFQKKGTPFIFTYFKEATDDDYMSNTDDMRHLFGFQDKLRSLGYSYTIYEDIPDLRSKFKEQIDKSLLTFIR